MGLQEVFLPSAKIAVVIPCYKVKAQIIGVIEKIGTECRHIFVIDDCCPEQSGKFVLERVADSRVIVLFHEQNQGVGGAVMTGYRAALGAGAEIIVKVDGDGQMNPALISTFVLPIIRGEADYTKGNRFYSLYNVRQMPRVRLFGNAVLSFMTKLSSGYWTVFDPTNGYTAIHVAALQRLEFKNISKRYFFESDMLVNLGGVRAVVRDIPMEAIYADEKSSLKINTVVGEFFAKNIREAIKRIFYSYYFRDFNIASVNLALGLVLLLFGGGFGGIEWWNSTQSGMPATTGTVMIAMLPIILGFQLLLNFVSFDIANEPTLALRSLWIDHQNTPTAADEAVQRIRAVDP